MQPSVPGPLALLDATEGFAKRKKTSLWFVGSLLVVSVSILTVGLTATTRTENVTMGGYYPGIILGFGAFLGIIGINLVENRRQVLFAAIVFISFGVVAAFCCAIVDGMFAARHIEPRPLTAGRCQFFASEVGYVHDTYQTEVTCHSSNGQCQLKVRSSTCYCCDLYNCQSTEHPPAYYEFVGVHRCQDVLHLYRLLWASALLNVLGVLLGIVTAAVLGAFKDMVPLSQLAYGPSALPQILYNPAQQILAYTGFCPSPATLPTCSSYPLPLQVGLVLPGRSQGSYSFWTPPMNLPVMVDLHEPKCSPDSLGTRWSLEAGSCWGLFWVWVLTSEPWRCGGFPASTPRDPPLSEDVQPPNTPSLCAPAHFLPGEKPPPYTP
ncbi:transmembrane protein 255B [Lycaon pictus]